jgi:hypothetical protein
MALTEGDRRFIEKRRSLVRRTFAVGIVLLVAIIAVAAYLYTTNPLLMKPVETSRLLGDKRVPEHVVAEMAAKLPVVFLVCCGLLVALVLFQLAAAVSERRLLKILDSLDGGGDGAGD